MKRTPENARLPRGIFVGKDRWYWLRFTDQFGKIRREKGSVLLEHAKAALERRRTEVRQLRFFPERIKQRQVLFGHAAHSYLKIVTARKRSWREDASYFKTLLPHLKDLPIDTITAGKVEEVLSEISTERQWKPATFNRARAVLSALFQWLVRKGQLQVNPVRLTPRNPREKENVRVRWLSDDEQARLLDAVRRSRHPERVKDVLTALHSGMRRSEMYRTRRVPDGGLKWEHINWRAGVIRLPRSKGGKVREIPMNSTLIDTLRSIPPRIGCPFVFPTLDEGWFKRRVKDAQIDDFHSHDLRHTFASRLAMNGVPILHIRDLMGHADVSVTLRYAHLAPGHLRAAVETLTRSDTASSTEQAAG
jgi:integrase